MDKIEFMGLLLNAVDAVEKEHKYAQTQSEHLYTLGQLNAYKQVIEWIKRVK